MKSKCLLLSIGILSCGSLWSQWDSNLNNGTEDLYWNNNVGIGPAFNATIIGFPTQTLDVDGNVRIRGLSLVAQQNDGLTRVLVADNNGVLYWRDVATISEGFSGSFNDLTDLPVNLDTNTTDDFDGNFASLSGIPADLSDGDDVDDADADPANEYNTLFQVNGANLEITDGGSTLSVPIADISSSTLPSFPSSAGDTGGPTNSFFGHQAGNATTGLNNTFIGYQSGLTNTDGYENTFVGRNSGFGNATGFGNVFIGYNAGANAGFSTANKLYIDNSDTDDPLIWGDFTDGNEQLIVNGDVSVGTLTSQESLHVTGNVQTDGNIAVAGTITATQFEGSVSWNNITDVPDDLIPVGVILMWSGSVNDVPPGWAVCDGSSGTPDLRARFIVGAGGIYDPGNTGGYNEITLTPDEMPSHNHSITDPGHNHTNGQYQNLLRITGQDTADGANPDPGLQPDILNVAPLLSSTTGISVDNTGGGQAHENRPPYYALIYIMKINAP